MQGPDATPPAPSSRRRLWVIGVVVAVVLFAIVAGVLAANSGSGGSNDSSSPGLTITDTGGTDQYGYSAAMRSGFMQGCTKNGVSESLCGCMLRKIEPQVPPAQLIQIGANQGSLPPDVRQFVTTAAQQCVAEGAGSPTPAAGAT
ncbi:MAG TPA: hypothetical protein VGH10_11640 [Actinomycetota bacterium]